MPIVYPPVKKFSCQKCRASVPAQEGWFPIGWMRAVGMTYLRVVDAPADRTEPTEPEKVAITSRSTESIYFCPKCQKDHGLVLTLRKA